MAVSSSDPALELASAFLAGSRTDARQIPWHALTRQDLRVVRAWATQTLSPEPRRRLLRAVRRAVCRATRERPADASDVLTPPELSALTRSRSRCEPRRGLPDRAVCMLLDACRSDRSLAGRRDLAVILLLLNAGLSACDLTRLQTGDFDEASGLLRLRSPSPAQPRRLVVLDSDCLQAIADWLRSADAGHGPLFRPVRRGVAGLGALSAPGVRAILSRRALHAGLGPLRPSDLRDRFLAKVRERARRNDWQPTAVRYEDEDGQPAMLYFAQGQWSLAQAEAALTD